MDRTRAPRGDQNADSESARRIPPIGRLDQHSADQAIARALEIESLASDQQDEFTSGELHRAALEAGIDPEHLHQALVEQIEQRATAPKRSRFALWLLPEPISASTTIDADQPTALRRAEDHFRRHEGLVVGQRHADGATWHTDERMLSKFRSTVAAGPDRLAKVAGSDLRHRVHEVSDQRAVVAVHSNGDAPLFVARLGLALAAGVAGAALVLGNPQDIADVIQTLIGAGAIGTALFGAAVLGVRRWAATIRRSMQRSLVVLGDPPDEPLPLSILDRLRGRRS